MVVTSHHCFDGNLCHNFVFEKELKKPHVTLTGNKVFFRLILVIGLLGWLLLVVNVHCKGLLDPER